MRRKITWKKLLFKVKYTFGRIKNSSSLLNFLKYVTWNVIFLVWGSVFFHCFNSRRNKKNQAAEQNRSAERRLGNPGLDYGVLSCAQYEISIP